MAWGNKLSSDAETAKPETLQHAVAPFPFDARLHAPKGGLPPSVPVTCPEVLEAARLRELEEANKTPVERLQLSEDEIYSATLLSVRELVKILNDPKASDAAKLNATAQILSNAHRFREAEADRSYITTLAAVEQLEAERYGAEQEIPPHLRRGKK